MIRVYSLPDGTFSSDEEEEDDDEDEDDEEEEGDGLTFCFSAFYRPLHFVVSLTIQTCCDVPNNYP